MSNKKIVVTGASGFLGSHLVERIKDDEAFRVYALTSRPGELKDKIGGSSVVYLQKDSILRDGSILNEATIVNCAYPRNAGGPEIGDGLRYTQSVFEASVDNKAAAVINISSQSVYSQKRTEAATEDTPVCLESAYAVGKYAAELMLESACRGSDTAYTNLRMASLIGPDFDQRIVNRFVMKLMGRETITVLRQPKKMGFLDVEDAVNAIISVTGTPPAAWKQVYNVGNGQGYTVEHIYDTVAAELRNRTEIPKPIFGTGTDASSTEVSFDLLNRDTGFVPTIDLNESVKKIIASL